uniref:Uncharacterized protein n=1 Tax=Candidatus Kentrum sp. SD TaxID=2126332 RepID=A0A451BMJ0_9GAMM|nr:MAG: hypothetical protein BECKSD772D_GA0070982_10531 [Candidatus Kentron sp. SD]
MADKDIVSKKIIGKLAAHLAIHLLDLPIVRSRAPAREPWNDVKMERMRLA